MDPSEHDAPLPEALEQELRSLGEVQAPRELWTRVSLALTQEDEAPEELRKRVFAELKPHEAPVLPFPKSISARFGRIAVAAVLLAFGWTALQFEPQGATEFTARMSHKQLRDFYAAKVQDIAVEPDQLSPTARGFAQSMGATLPRRES